MGHKIDIKEPIWKKPRSIGLDVKNVPIGEIVEVSISYVNAAGYRLYPKTWKIPVEKIRNYPTKNIRYGIDVHIVPIDELNNLEKVKKVNNNKKIENMIFDKKSLEKIKKESDKAGERKSLIAPGVHVLNIEKVELTKAKDGNPMVIVEFGKDDEHNTFREWFKLAGPNTDIPREKLVKLFYKGFSYEIQPADTGEELMNQLTKFEGKSLKVAVRGKTALNSYDDKDGNAKMEEIIFPEYWYCGLANDDKFSIFDEKKLIKPLSDEDKDKLIKFQELNDQEAPEATEESATEENEFDGSIDDAEGDDYPF